MQLLSILSIAFVAAQSAQTAPQEIVNPVLKCFEDKKCGDDVNCKAACVGVPAPTADVVEKTNACYSQCNTNTKEEVSVCRAKCDGIFINSIAGPVSPVAPGNATNSSKGGNSTLSSTSSNAVRGAFPAMTFVASGLLAFAML